MHGTGNDPNGSGTFAGEPQDFFLKAGVIIRRKDDQLTIAQISGNRVEKILKGCRYLVQIYAGKSLPDLPSVLLARPVNA